MIRLTFFIISIFLANGLFAQDGYKVIKVKGTIVLMSSNIELARGMIFDDDDKLEFKSENAIAAVIKKGEGRFLLKQSDEKSLYAKANLSPAIPTMATRALGISSLKGLKYQFQEKVFINDTVKYYCKTRQLFKGKNDYLYLKYNYNGKEYSQKIETTKSTLVFNRSELFKEIPLNEEIEIETQLVYKNASSNTDEVVQTFISTLPNDKELKQEISAIIGEVNPDERSNDIQNIIGFISDFYGSIDYANASKIYENLTNN